MKQYNFFLFIFFMLANFSLLAQADDIDENLRSMELMRSSEVLVQNTVSEQQQLQKSGNTVFINQIGEGNVVNARLRASESANSIFQQTGDFNTINSTVTARNIENRIIQEGSNNQVFDYANAPGKDVSLNLMQRGDDLNFERFGSNAIGDKLQFNMTGSSKTIIVRNFQ